MTATPDNAEAQEPGSTENSNAIALGLIGDEWNLTIIRLAIMSGVRRYKDFRDRLGIANSVLTVRLRRLAEAGVFTMSQYSDAPRRYEYVLTERGRDLWKVLLTIWSWEAVWVTEHIEPLPPMYHTECGEEFSPVMHCRACGQPAGIRDVRGTFGPSGGFARSVPRATTRRRSAGGSPGPGLVPQTIELIGNRWSASALAAAFLGARRFTDMLVMMGAPPTIVSDRLRTFCQMGVLEPVVSQGRLGPGRVPAHGQGPGLLPARHGDARLGRPVVPRARGTGHPAHPHQLRRRVPPGPAVLGLPARAARLADPGRRRPAQGQMTTLGPQPG